MSISVSTAAERYSSVITLQKYSGKRGVTIESGDASQISSVPNCRSQALKADLLPFYSHSVVARSPLPRVGPTLLIGGKPEEHQKIRKPRNHLIPRLLKWLRG